ncbi:hypothetical protein CONPUDRAFT_134730 [Coniophora puteana RWD-64-598 SS2]|uniref:Uncharacterized protein n=1 Tax=Coniophora puteana (strain RWD-64-598) TaxID=741705 RepID=A0A5M3N0U1_CONPW|nr:uncharacterized protein CONPUDRAFT_134730 [Coniophora puteana RWD-64-598 SS2]EIW84867.1 hypothetical protein CONPUDRAFT_134730 [Coniophora puteana RWD-64-598 SS2]
MHASDQVGGAAHTSISPTQSPQIRSDSMQTPRAASCDSSPQQRPQVYAPSRMSSMAPLLPRRSLGHASCASAPSLSTTGLAQVLAERGQPQSHSQPSSAHPDFDPRQFSAGSFPTSSMYTHGLYNQYPYATARQHIYEESPPAVGYPDASMALPLSAPSSGFGTSSGELLPQASGQTEMSALFYTDGASGHATMQAVDSVGYMSPVGSNHSSLSSPMSASPSMAPPPSAYRDYSFQHAYASNPDYGMQNSALFESVPTFETSPTTFHSQMNGVMHPMDTHSSYVADQQAAFVQQQRQLQLQRAQGRNTQMQMSHPQANGHFDGHAMPDGYYGPYA